MTKLGSFFSKKTKEITTMISRKKTKTEDKGEDGVNIETLLDMSVSSKGKFDQLLE